MFVLLENVEYQHSKRIPPSNLGGNERCIILLNFTFEYTRIRANNYEQFNYITYRNTQNGSVHIQTLRLTKLPTVITYILLRKIFIQKSIVS